MKITKYFWFAVALVELTLIGICRALPVILAFAFFTVISAVFYCAALAAIYLFLS